MVRRLKLLIGAIGAPPLLLGTIDRTRFASHFPSAVRTRSNPTPNTARATGSSAAADPFKWIVRCTCSWVPPGTSAAAGEEDSTGTSAEAYQVWYQIEVEGEPAWVQAAVPVFNDTGSDGRPSSVRFDFLPLVSAPVG